MELQAVEEMLAMKKRELKAFDSDVDSESEKEFVCIQIKKLRKKQRSLTLLVCGGTGVMTTTVHKEKCKY